MDEILKRFKELSYDGNAVITEIKRTHSLNPFRKKGKIIRIDNLAISASSMFPEDKYFWFTDEVFRPFDRNLVEKLQQAFVHGWPFPSDYPHTSRFPYMHTERRSIDYEFEGRKFPNTKLDLMALVIHNPPLYVIYDGNYDYGYSRTEPIEPLKEAVYQMAISLGEKKENLREQIGQYSFRLYSFDIPRIISSLKLPD